MYACISIHTQWDFVLCQYKDYRVLSCMHVYLFIHNEILYIVPQDTQFSQILQDSLDFFNIPEEDYPLYFLVDTKSSQFIFVACIPYFREYKSTGCISRTSQIWPKKLKKAKISRINYISRYYLYMFFVVVSPFLLHFYYSQKRCTAHLLAVALCPRLHNEISSVFNAHRTAIFDVT